MPRFAAVWSIIQLYILYKKERAGKFWAKYYLEEVEKHKIIFFKTIELLCKKLLSINFNEIWWRC